MPELSPEDRKRVEQIADGIPQDMRDAARATHTAYFCFLQSMVDKYPDMNNRPGPASELFNDRERETYERLYEDNKRTERQLMRETIRSAERLGMDAAKTDSLMPYVSTHVLEGTVGACTLSQNQPAATTQVAATKPRVTQPMMTM
jgi:hypothetical protein